MAKLNIYEDFCKGCGLCIEFCPKKILTFKSTLNKFGFHPVMQIAEKANLCTGCGICRDMCPDMAIEVIKE